MSAHGRAPSRTSTKLAAADTKLARRRRLARAAIGGCAALAIAASGVT
jgi:hypothetical protein